MKGRDIQRYTSPINHTANIKTQLTEEETRTISYNEYLKNHDDFSHHGGVQAERLNDLPKATFYCVVEAEGGA